MCPHGGMVAHVPTNFPSELISGELPMLLTDLYFVVGCPFSNPYSFSPCLRVQWTMASVTKLISGVPVLTNASVGMCNAGNNAPQGAANVVSHQTVVTD